MVTVTAGWSIFFGCAVIALGGLTLVIGFLVARFRGAHLHAVPWSIPVLLTCLLAVMAMLVGSFVVVASIHLLRLRAWARRALEVIYWAGLACMLGEAAWAAITWPYILPYAFWAMGPASAMVSVVLVAAGCVAMISLLRSTAIRDAVRG